MVSIPVELQMPLIEKPFERWRYNWDKKAVLYPILMGCATCLWRVWFWNEVGETTWRVMVGFWVMWCLLYWRSCRDPGWVTEKNYDKYMLIYGADAEGEIARSEVSEGTLNRVARFDHHNVFLGLDVGRENHISYHLFLAFSALWGITVFLVSLQYYAYQTEWSRPSYVPPGAWEMFLILALFVEGYCRTMIFFYSVFSVGCRYLLSLDHWLLLSYEFSKANFIWGLYYIPVFIGCMLAWYAFAYTSVFCLHGFLMASWNMTLNEACKISRRIAVPNEKFRSLSGLFFLLWSDVVGAMGSVVYFKSLKVLQPGDAAPDGFLVLDRSHGFWDMWGTLPCPSSKFSKGTAMANIKDIWSTAPLSKSTSRSHSAAQHIPLENPLSEVVVHDSTLV
eukprot:TRINITY_DN15923_c0_g1_i3.p1 TRINITY_DN15923_c0_g1~~TRINITY_DN15923_c0_g1_i3.p1  ORF type:complete len:407 (+),score=91.50 TRINITY_DN15923_c0_g1_i3:46-1221(+)